jgi:hypothetical protein
VTTLFSISVFHFKQVGILATDNFKFTACSFVCEDWQGTQQ